MNKLFLKHYVLLYFGIDNSNCEVLGNCWQLVLRLSLSSCQSPPMLWCEHKALASENQTALIQRVNLHLARLDQKKHPRLPSNCGSMQTAIWLESLVVVVLFFFYLRTKHGQVQINCSVAMTTGWYPACYCTVVRMLRWIKVGAKYWLHKLVLEGRVPRHWWTNVSELPDFPPGSGSVCPARCATEEPVLPLQRVSFYTTDYLYC